MKPWSRNDTKDWISHLEHRVEDIDYYLWRTIEWCESHRVYDNETVFACSLMTVLWVCDMRDEQISRKEVFEILGVTPEDNDITDDLLNIGSKFKDRDIEEILYSITRYSKNL